MMCKSLLFILSALLCTTSLAQKFELNDRVKDTQDLMYQLRLNEAKSLIKIEESENPDNAFLPYLKFTHDFFKIFISESESAFEEIEDDFEDNIDLIKDAEDESAWKDFCLSEMYIMSASIKIKFGNRWGAGWDGLKAYNLLKENMEDYPEFEPQWLNMGILHINLGSIPDNYKFIASIFGVEGDIEKGKNLIEKAWQNCRKPSENYRYVKTAFMYGYANYFFSLNEFDDLADLDIDPNKSNLLVFLQVKVLQKNNRNTDIIHLLENRSTDKKYFPFYYLDYLEGKSKLVALRKDANIPFEKYLNNYPGKDYIKASHGFLSWYYRIYNNPEKAAYHKGRVFDSGNTYTGADKMAIHYMSQNENIYLIKAHLSFDNADYVNARNMLNKLKNTSLTTEERIEWHYFSGRIYQMSGEPEKAKNSFIIMLNVNSEIDNSYYLANGCLLLGEMYEKTADNGNARKFYQMVYDFSDYPFSEGIQQKAKAGLKRLD